MSTAVGADPERVWRALSVPDEQIRWRCRLGSIAVVLRRSLLEVVPRERLRSVTEMGLLRFDETFTLGYEAGDLHRTRLQLKLIAANTIPIVGGLLDRFAVRRIATDLIDAKLRAIQKWCETHP